MEVLTWNESMSAGKSMGADPLSDEENLIAACRSGDPDAFAELIKLHERRVFKLAGRFFRQPHEVEAVAQETFVKAWSKLNTYRAEAPFEHWLTRVCLNCCYARLRKHRPTEALQLDRFEAPPKDPDARLEVEALLRRLEPADRFVLTLLYAEGWSVAEIAERLGWSSANVKVRAFRARKKLRRVLEGSS